MFARGQAFTGSRDLNRVILCEHLGIQVCRIFRRRTTRGINLLLGAVLVTIMCVDPRAVPWHFFRIIFVRIINRANRGLCQIFPVTKKSNFYIQICKYTFQEKNLIYASRPIMLHIIILGVSRCIRPTNSNPPSIPGLNLRTIFM